MDDLRKVIKGLECAIGIRGLKNCDDCPYDNDFNCLGCDIVMWDAVKLLKEREPRVLTWNEVEHAEVCWLEKRGFEPYASLDAYEWNPEVYGKRIRCWNYKPTKEQREAVKWDG